MWRSPRFTKLFRSHYRKILRSHRHDCEKIDAVMRMLIRKQELPARHCDHALHEEWDGCRDCHIEGDWVLIYELDGDDDGQETITFHATGTHESLFG